MGYRKDNRIDNLPAGEELFMSMISFVQFILLGTFAAILSAHRSDILDKPGNGDTNASTGTGSYEAPYAAAQ